MLSRKLVFYKWSSADSSSLFDPHKVIERLDKEIHRHEDFEILDSGEFSTAVLPTQFSDPSKPVQLRLLALRGGTKLPAKWSPDSPIESINLLEGEYSADVSHVCIWNDGVAAQEFHRDAPRLGRLSLFLKKKLDEKVLFEGLYNPNMFERLEEIRGRVRQVHISLLKPDVWAQPKQPGAFDTLFPAVAGTRTPSLKVAIGIGRYGGRDKFLDPEIEGAAFELAANAQDQVDSLIIGGISSRTGKTERINLLNERVHKQIELHAERLAPSIPDRAETFSAMEETRSAFDDINLINEAIQAQAVHK